MSRQTDSRAIGRGDNHPTLATAADHLKTARILDMDGGGFGLEYDNNLGKRNTTRLDAGTYEKAVTEARLFLEINPEDIDSDGTRWEFE